MEQDRKMIPKPQSVQKLSTPASYTVFHVVPNRLTFSHTFRTNNIFASNYPLNYNGPFVAQAKNSTLSHHGLAMLVNCNQILDHVGNQNFLVFIATRKQSLRR